MKNRIAKLLCRIFGHRHGWCHGRPYGSAEYRTTDCIGRTHFDVRTRCERCGEKYTMARFHGSKELALKMARGRR